MLPRELRQGLVEGVTAGDLHVPIRAEHQQRGPADLPGQELQEEERRPIGPVQVVQQEDQRPAVGRALQERRDCVEQAEPCLLRLQRRWRRQVRQPLAHLRHDLGDVGGPGTHVGAEVGGVMATYVGPDGLDPRPVGRRSLALVASPHERQGSALDGVTGELQGGARLANARLARKHQEASVTSERLLQQLLQLAHLLVPPDEHPLGQSLRRDGLLQRELSLRGDCDGRGFG